MMTSNRRLVLIDVLRGVAIALMIIYHFCYDLTYFKITDFDFYNNEFWLQSRNLIVSLFVFIVGISLVLATQNGINWKSFNKRLVLIILSALMISIVTYFIFPGRTIFFGVLHFIATASIMGLLFYKYYRLNLFVGLIIIFTGVFIQAKTFDNAWLQWIGFMTHKPATEDYVPVFPWFGVVLLGMYAGKTILKSEQLRKISATVSENKIYTGLELFGKHSLLIYLIHQPILMGILFVLV